MPMTRDEDFGTNLNHSPNHILIAKEMGIPEDQAKQMVENILPQLKRWRTTR
jgi:hypothetical protein